MNSSNIRYIPFILALSLGMPLHAENVGKFTAATNYLWRGVTQTSDSPAVAVALEYYAPQGSYLGIWSSSTNYGDRQSYEVHGYLGHGFKLAEVDIDLALRYYYFPDGGKYSFDFQPDKWENRESSDFTEGRSVRLTRG